MPKDLPVDIIKEILLRLPVKSLLRFKCVSKDWQSFIGGSSFITLYHNRSTAEKSPSLIFAEATSFYTIQDEDNSCHKVVDLSFSPKIQGSRSIKVVGSCNGLLCFSISRYYCSHHKDPIYLLNPATRELKELPNPHLPYKSSYNETDTVLGFGFDPTAEDYKVVKVVYSFETETMMLQKKKDVDVRVYSLNCDKWRKLGGHILVPDLIDSGTKTVVVNATIHWMNPRTLSLEEPSGCIISFDLINEVFLKFPLPQQIQIFMDVDILVVGGCLSVYNSQYRFRTRHEIWMMKEYGVKESWTKHLIDLDSNNRSTAVEFWNDEILLRFEFDHNNLILYNTKSKIQRNLGIRNVPECSKAFSHTESLVMLKGLQYVQGNKQKGKRRRLT